MIEKNKEAKSTPGNGSDSVFDGLADLTVNKNVSVSSGPYCEDLPVTGTSVSEVRRKFGDRFDIDAQSQAIVNGAPVDENYILNAGESLMFIRHAGEKGMDVTIEGPLAMLDSGQTMKVEDLCARVGPGLSTGPVILPSGIKSVLSQGQLTLWVWEQPPRVHQLSWIKSDSPKPYGPGTTYRNVTIALPYVVVVATFVRTTSGIPRLLKKDECFFRTAPLKSLNDELSYPGLLNCSKWGAGTTPPPNTPLSWICTQHLKQTKKMMSLDPGDQFQSGFEAVRYCLLETSFNLSSEHHEGNSWYGASKQIDPRIATIEAWEKATKKNPLFVLDVPWIKSGHSVRQVAERIFRNNLAAGAPVKTADDLARIIINQ